MPFILRLNNAPFGLMTVLIISCLDVSGSILFPILFRLNFLDYWFHRLPVCEYRQNTILIPCLVLAQNFAG